MRAQDHTDKMLHWWSRVGIDRADLAVRRSDGAMLWHTDQALATLPLTWARAHNAHKAEVYVRPARGYRWPLLFLDDLPEPAASAVARKYAALVVCTSPAGGCHVWLRASMSLDEDQRRQAQRYLARRIGADRASISGEHLGRLAGFKNWKRDGVWVNLLQASSQRPWEPRPALLESTPPTTRRRRSDPNDRQTSPHRVTDTSPSGADWAFTCHLLEAGCDPALVLARLVQSAQPRRGPDTQRYANRTIKRALRHLARTTTKEPNS
jgi:hypothetical protein